MRGLRCGECLTPLQVLGVFSFRSDPWVSALRCPMHQSASQQAAAGTPQYIYHIPDWRRTRILRPITRLPPMPKWAYILTSFYFTVVKTKIFFFFISFVKATAWLRLHLSNKPSYGMAGEYKSANSYTPIPDQTCETAVSMYSSTHVWPRPSSNWLPTYLSSIGALWIFCFWTRWWWIEYFSALLLPKQGVLHLQHIPIGNQNKTNRADIFRKHKKTVSTFFSVGEQKKSILSTNIRTATGGLLLWGGEGGGMARIEKASENAGVLTQREGSEGHSPGVTVHFSVVRACSGTPSKLIVVVCMCGVHSWYASTRFGSTAA